MPESAIVLATLNAKYIHAAFGLRYLLANLQELASQTSLLEFDIQQAPLDIAERVLRESPRIVGFGVYIWNVTQTAEVVAILRRVRPDVLIVLGGPEVSYESEGQRIVELADYVIPGEADVAFRELCRTLLAGERPASKIQAAALPQPAELQLPYDLYSEEDLTRRVLYLEASRGCPFTCEFCLSSLDIPVRQFDVDVFLAALERLWQRGARTFKFVDRTFNLNLRTSKTILEFFLERAEQGCFAHFEMVPDRLPQQLRDVIARFPPAALQFEIGIQTFNPEVSARISRRQDYARIDDNLRFLRQQTGVHLHVDLIAGLPGEDLRSFAAGFDRLLELKPQEIQVGILKRLRGTPIGRHDAEWGMKYGATPPYEVLETKVLSFEDLQRMRRFARYWDLVANSGRFAGARELFRTQSSSAFAAFMDFSDWLYIRVGRRHAISPANLAAELFFYFTDRRGLSPEELGPMLISDLSRSGCAQIPSCLQPYAREVKPLKREAVAAAIPIRQARHAL
jgi:radical SAM superfamily enzyme YgiQ (UPF0313 family)